MSFIIRCSALVRHNSVNKNICGFLQKRESSYFNSEFVEDIKKTNIKYEVTKSPTDWNFVERLLPPQCVPEPIPRKTYVSGWKPQVKDLQDRPYYIGRTKNHMMPVYLELAYHDTKRTTRIRKIDGDIWLLENDLRKFLESQNTKAISTQVNEFAGYIRIRGDHVNAIKYWLTKNHF